MTGAKVTPVASFPPNFFLENLVIRHDGSILITVTNQKHLYYVPRPDSGVATPQFLHTFEHSTTGIVELGRDVFHISTTLLSEDSPNILWRLDMRNLTPTAVLEPMPVLTFPPESKVLNGFCVLSSSVILRADSWADLIWRVDILEDCSAPSARVWLKHNMLAHSDDPKKFDVPGVNGVKFNHKDGHVYFTITAQTTLGRIRIDPGTLDCVGDPEDVTERWMWGDDLIIDKEAGVAYVTTHRQNTIERINLKSIVRM
ncbi:hypothetical protein AOQ84DRAFT_228863 [Glonium stellatum]|uniref:Uncharacterized protein n=1 Tax=Glonium stellatum TaxID=574774 RepID=A0A8E2JWG7_9PEZI|nr:hypothetical protein AOQ84DRAFT_228863 [Glonium stellatum]